MLNIRKLSYETYKQKWVEDNTTAEMRIKTTYDYSIEKQQSYSGEYSFEDYIFDYGYDGSCYVCYDEFIDNEYQDKDYMTEVLTEAGCNDDVYEMYLKDLEYNFGVEEF